MKVYKEFDLTNYNSYRIRAVCRRAFFPENDADIVSLFNNQNENSNYVLLGGGYNVLLSKEYYNNDFVIFADNYSNIDFDGNKHILCQAGCNMKTLSEFCLDNNLSGLEIFYDIPSSLGGAIVMNAGAGGEDIHGLLERVWYFNPDKSVIDVIENKDIGFEYRNSFFQKNPKLIVCQALLRVQKGEREIIFRKMEDTKLKRWAKQPREYPNAGSVFKRPTGKFVGPMIDQLGLKGFSIGGAKISEKHSGFIINYKNATGDDILRLISHIKMKVRDKFLIELEVEQRII